MDEILAYIVKLENSTDHSAEDAAAEACDLYSALSGQINVIKEWQIRVKAILTDVIIETGQTDWKGEIARCYIPKPSKSVRYDAKALDILCIGNPELTALLAPFRRETERAGSLTIR